MATLDLDSMLRALQDALVATGATVATAESCTGGLLATLLTHLPGSSAVYLGGVSAYANEAKIQFLDVEEASLAQFGAVSAQVAESMARGVQKALQSTYALSLTGVAGPDGGTQQKPVGTVFCGIAGPSGTRHVKLQLKGGREQIRALAAQRALAELARETGLDSMASLS